MSKQIRFEGKSYSFPDAATDAQIMGALQAMRAPKMNPEQAATFATGRPAVEPPKALQAPLPRMPAQPPIFATPDERDAEDLARADRTAQSRVAQQALPVGDADAELRALAKEREKALADIRAERDKVLSVGQLDKAAGRTDGITPMLRTTRIQDVPVYAPPLRDPLLENPAQDRALTPPLRDLETYAPPLLDPIETWDTPIDPGLPVYKARKMYLDPETKQFRVPTDAEKLIEATARQTVLSPEAARQRGDALRLAQEEAEIDRDRHARELKAANDKGLTAAEAGVKPMQEARSYLGVAPGPLVSGMFSAPNETPGTGVGETRLGASTRLLGALEALAGEAYFRGLGYEVDAKGMPVDPDDLGYWIAQQRKGFFDAVGIEDRPVLVLPGLAPPVILPGQATRSRKAGEAGMGDPEGRRTVSPEDTFIDRFSKSLASGRGLGDEFMDAPDVVAAYADKFGSDEAAYWGGLATGLLIPAGPGLLLKGSSLLARGGAKAAGASARAARPLAKAISGGVTATGVERVIDSGIKKALDFAEDVEAVTTKGKASDARIARKVGERLVDADFAATPAQKAAQKAAIEGATPFEVAVEINDTRKALGLPQIKGLGEQIKMNVPDDLVMVSESVAVPRVVAKDVQKLANEEAAKIFRGDDAAVEAALRAKGDLLGPGRVTYPRGIRPVGMPALADEAKAAGGFSKLPPARRAEFVDLVRTDKIIRETPRLTAAVAANGVGTRVRVLSDVSDVQVYLGGMAKPSLLDSQAARRFKATFGSVEDRKKASVALAEDRIRGAASSAIRSLGSRLSREARDLGSVPAALDKIAAEELASASPVSIWKKVLSETYGGDVAERIMVDLAPNLPRAFPTVEQMAQVDRNLVAAGQVPSVPGYSPDFRKVFVKVIVDEGIKKNIAQRGRKEEALLFGAQEKIPNAVSGLPGARFNAPLPTRRAGKPTLFTGPEGRVTRTYDPAASRAEKILSENGEEFARIAESTPIAKSAGATQAAADAASFSARFAKDTYQGAKYGYVLPNLPYLSGRLMQIPLISLSTIGAEKTLKATLGTLAGTPRIAGEAASDMLPFVSGALRDRRFGGNLRTVNGVAYTPDEIAKLADEFGLGLSLQDTQRVGSLAEDMLADAVRAGGGVRGAGRAAFDLASPSARSFWLRMAEGVELRYRQQVFEGALASGASPREAAQLARKSLFDYGAIGSDLSPAAQALKDTAVKYIATAAQDYAIASEFVEAVARNPEALAKAARIKQRAAQTYDPYGERGDKALKSLGIIETAVDGEANIAYLPEIPIYAPIEDALGIMAQADSAAVRVLDALGEAADGKPLAATGTVAEGVLKASGAVVQRYATVLADTFRAMAAVRGGIKPGGAEDSVSIGSMTDEQVYWAALVLADIADPDRTLGEFNEVLRLTGSIKTKPPADFALGVGGGEEFYWVTQPPEGIPYILAGETERGIPLYLSFAPSKNGIQNIRTARKLPFVGELAAKGLTGYAAWVLEDAPNVRPGAVLPGGVSGAASALAGLEPGGPASLEQVRMQQAEAIKALAEKR